MGVPGLWEILAPVGTSVSLHKLALDAFEQNTSGKRAYRCGIDASLWFRHACMVKEGENPELRTLFFRVKELAKLPILPLFVFDGRSRPKVKRGSRMGKSGSHSLTAGFKKLLDAFGMHWREAEGEAEAELAFLNRAGIIDAIMTDDVDCFLFGAITVIKNQSLQLSGNRSNPALDLDGKPSKHHVMVYNFSLFSSHPDIGLSRGGLILFALLTGGDYDKGVDKVGKVTAHALARSGLGDELDRALREREHVSLHNFIPQWRERINYELQTNARGFLSRAAPGLRLPPSFPSLDVLDKYVNPAVRMGGTQGIWTDKELNLAQVAAFCEAHFEWATRDTIIRRFRTLMWDGCVTRVLKRAALVQDERELEQMHALGIDEATVQHCARPDEAEAVGTRTSMIAKYLNIGARQNQMDRISAAFVNRPSKANSREDTNNDLSPSFISKVHSSRQHVSTDRSLEYRIEIDPSTFVELAQSGIKGTRTETKTPRAFPDDLGDDMEDDGRRRTGTSRVPPDPTSPLRLWCPAQMLWRVNPRLVRDFEERKGGRRVHASPPQESSPTPTQKTQRPTKINKRKAAEVESIAESDFGGYEDASTRAGKRIADRDPVRRRLFTEDTRTTSQTFGVGDLLSKVAEKPRSKRPVARVQSNPNIPLSQRTDFMAPLEIAHKAAVLKRISSTPLASDHLERMKSSISHPEKTTPPPGIIDANAKRTSYPFLFSMQDPCDPSLVQREDLREQPDLTVQWTELDSDQEPDSDNDSILNGQKELDRILQRNFMAKATASNATFKLKEKPKPKSLVNHIQPSAAALGYTESPPRAMGLHTSGSPSSSQQYRSYDDGLTWSETQRSDSNSCDCEDRYDTSDVIDISSDNEDDEDIASDDEYDEDISTSDSGTLVASSPPKNSESGSQTSLPSYDYPSSSSQEYVTYIDLCD